MTKELNTEWSDNNFVLEALEHCHKVVLPENCKIVLLLESCSVHLDADVLSVQKCFCNTSSLQLH